MTLWLKCFPDSVFEPYFVDRGKLYTFGDGRHGKLAQGEECFSNLFKPQVVSRFADFNVQYVSCGGCHTLVIAVKREEDLSDDEDAEDNILNSSMASTYSHASMPEANATMRLGLQGLSNTLPLISPRDKRRKKEAEVKKFFTILEWLYANNMLKTTINYKWNDRLWLEINKECSRTVSRTSYVLV